MGEYELKVEIVLYLFMISFCFPDFPPPLFFRRHVSKFKWKRLPGHISVAFYPIFRDNRTSSERFFPSFLSSTYIESLNVVSALDGFDVA